MGVKDLWSILSPIRERKPLWELQGKSVAIDLSCWVCDSQNLTENYVQPRMYLRNLFFRTSCLLLMDVKPVFVLEGDAPALKHATISRRNQQQYGRSNSQKSQDQHSGKRGSRKRFMSILKQCEQLLELMGLPCVQSQGEAEALCARLNLAGVVDGCISQDGDCFLYGAQTVYRNFTISHSGTDGSSAYSIDVYEMATVVDRLSLSRSKLVALSILCGCDYNEKGVVGVGKETALKFLHSVGNEDALDRLCRWCSDPYFEQLEAQRLQMSRKDLCEKCGHNGRKVAHDRSGCNSCQLSRGCVQDKQGLRGMDIESRKSVLVELNLRRKALQDPQFPYQQLIDEFMAGDVELPRLNWLWRMPQIEKFVNFAVKMLAWTEDYAREKFLPLASRWHLKHGDTESLRAQAIRKQCVRKGMACLEVEWSFAAPWLEPSVTIEPTHLVQAAYPELVQEFLSDKEARKRKPKKKAKSKVAVPTSVAHKCTAGPQGKCRGCLNHFLQCQDDRVAVEAVEHRLAGLSIDEEKENMVPGSATKKRRKPAKRKETKDTLKNLLVRTGENLDNCSRGKQCLLAKDKLVIAAKKENENFNFDASLCKDDSLNFSCCSKCEDDGTMDLSSIINGIVSRENVLQQLRVSDRQSVQTPIDSTPATKSLQCSSVCVQSTPGYFVDVNFSLGTSNFLTSLDDSLL